MDPLTHAALGAVSAQSVARPAQIAAAASVGALAALAPDADILIRSATDPIVALEYHRHFTHSLAFIPVGGLGCALLFFPLCRSWLRFTECLRFCLVGYGSHGLLDACTNYGTRLFWPISKDRLAFDVVSAIDPLVTLPLLFFAAYALVRRRPRIALLGLGCCLAYLGAGALQHRRAHDAAIAVAAARGHSPAQVELMPTVGNIVLWRSIYASGDEFLIDALRVGLGTRVFPGQRLRQLDIARDFPWLRPGMQQWNDLQGFAAFASGYLALDPAKPNRVIDIRYSFLPDRADSFWGLELDADRGPEEHAAYVTMRIRSGAEGREFLGMLFQGGSEE